MGKRVIAGGTWWINPAMGAWSFEGGASRIRRSALRAGALVAVVSCGCGNVVIVDETGGSTGTDSFSSGGGGATTTSGMGGAGGSAGEGGVGPGGSGTTTTFGCTGNADCIDDPKGPLCDPETGECVSCLVAASAAADCGVGKWCNPAKGECEIGCTGDEDCPSFDAPLFCDVADHTCKGCSVDTDCPIGTVCVSGQCSPGCSFAAAVPGRVELLWADLRGPVLGGGPLRLLQQCLFPCAVGGDGL